LPVISGFVLYLIKVRFIILSMAGFATRDHRVSACRRSGPPEGFGRQLNILHRILRLFRFVLSMSAA
jgi:hypothetical protein